MSRRKLEPAEKSIIVQLVGTYLLVHRLGCRRRLCRRARWCSVSCASTNPLYGDTTALCVAQLSMRDADIVEKHISLLVRICNGEALPYPSPLPDVRAKEEEAVIHLRGVAALLPDFADHIAAWTKTYNQPPPPDIDTGAVLKELGAEMKRMGLKW